MMNSIKTVTLASAGASSVRSTVFRRCVAPDSIRPVSKRSQVLKKKLSSKGANSLEPKNKTKFLDLLNLRETKNW
jgi:hypothetical protein